LNDEKLSFKAKGILAYLLSKPDNWQVRVGDLIKHSPEGRTSIYSGLKELKKYGYLKKNPVRIDGKIHHWESVVYEVPISPEIPHIENLVEVDNTKSLKNESAENLHTENLNIEKPYLENPQYNNKRDKINNDNNNQLVSHSETLNKRMSDQANEQTNEINQIISNARVDSYESEEMKETIKDIIRECYIDPVSRPKARKLKLEHVDSAIANYRIAQEEKEIKNPKLYFKKCLLSAIEESGLKGLF
jgi:hypothetical protein